MSWWIDEAFYPGPDEYHAEIAAASIASLGPMSMSRSGTYCSFEVTKYDWEKIRVYDFVAIWPNHRVRGWVESKTQQHEPTSADTYSLLIRVQQ